MYLYILDRAKKPLGILDTEDGNNAIFNDSYKSYLSNGSGSYEFSVVLNDDLSVDIIEGNYILFFLDTKIQLLQIVSCEDEEGISKVTRTSYCETINLELYNSHVRPTIVEGTVKAALTTILQDTNYQVGNISPTLSNVIGTVVVDKITPVYNVLQDLKNVYDGIELEFRTEVVDRVQGKYNLFIDVYGEGERGRRTYKRFEYDFNTYGTKRTGDISEFCSGLVAQGANGITFKNTEWLKADGDPLDKPLGQDFLVDPEAHAMLNNGGKVILGTFTSTATTEKDLLYETYNKLQELKQKKFTYEVPVFMTEDQYHEVQVGDTVYVVNPKFNPPIQLEARISILELSFTKHTANKVTLSNYKVVRSKIKTLTTDDIIKEAINAITGLGVGKLTESSILLIQQYLSKLDIDKEEVDKIINNLLDKYKEPIPQIPKTIPEDSEDYTSIKLKNLEKGLWIGDDRIANVKQWDLGTVITKEESQIITTKPAPSSPNAQEYKNAVKYYEQWDLAKSKNDTKVNQVLKGTDKYKIGVMVRYWAAKFGLDTRLVYALMRQESGMDPYNATSSSIGGYGLMQCERGVYFNKKQTIKFLDGSTKSFTPSYSTMKPGNGTTTVNGVKVDKNINNQIMFGCHELRKNIEQWHYNIFATLVGYNMGIGAMGWIIIKYVCDTYGYTFNNGRNISTQPAHIKKKCYEVLENYKMPWHAYRQQWKDYNGGGTVKHVEYVLRYYIPYNNSLPYAKNAKGTKIGYGVNPPSSMPSTQNTGSKTRQIIVDLAKDIVQDHKNGKATYDQAYRTIDYDKPRRHPGTFYGLKNPVCYDCSSFVGCCYDKAGIPDLKGLSCSAGTLVKKATAKSGWKAWKVTSSSIADAKIGDIVMDANYKIDATTIAKNPNYCSTHHTMIYIGDGKVAHASKWAYKPDAIKISTLTYYINKGSAFFLRPYQIKKFDDTVTATESNPSQNPGEIIIHETIVQEKKITEFTIKGLKGARAKDYMYNDMLYQSPTIDDVTDNVKFPTTLNYVFVHFGINGILNDETNVIDECKNLILHLKKKYPKTTIFVAKELHASSKLTDYDDINTKINNLNLELQELCNTEDYVIFLDVSKNLLDSNGRLKNELTNDGFSFKDKASTEIYYAAVKDAILNKRIGGVSKLQQNQVYVHPKATCVYLTFNKTMTHKYEVPLTKLELTMPTSVYQDFWSRVIFTTKSSGEPTKFKQPDELYLEGDDCVEGALLPQAATTYTITCFANVVPEDYPGFSYFGTVTKQVKEGQYTDFPDFVGGKEMVSVAWSYYTNRNNLKYTELTATPMDYSNPAANISKWKFSDGKMGISSRAFSKLVCMGVRYEDSPYNKNELTSVKRNTNYGWTWTPSLAASWFAKAAVEQGWALTGIDMINFTNVEKGDIIFYSRSYNSNFMSISDLAIATGIDEGSGLSKALMVDSLGTTKTLIHYALNDTTLANAKPSQIVLIVRPRKE